MLTISNTSPVFNLAIIGQLDLLRRQFGLLYIPAVVRDELRPDEDLPGSIAIQRALNDGWLSVVEAELSGLVRELARELDLGEAYAIAMAMERNASYVLLDERDGRRTAKRLGLNVTGILGILLRAKLDGSYLPALHTAHFLQHIAQYRIHPHEKQQQIQLRVRVQVGGMNLVGT